MRKIRKEVPAILPVLAAALLFCGCIGQNGSRPRERGNELIEAVSTGGQAFISFDTTTHDFGTIIEGERVMCYFSYSNKGDADLMISRVEASCGCTTPDWSREPLSPGDRETMGIVFDASGRSGAQRKQIVVHSNSEPQTVTLTIMAQVNKN